MGRGAWWAALHGAARVGHDLVTKQQQYVYTHTHTHIHTQRERQKERERERKEKVILLN